MMEYKGYYGKVEFDDEADIFHGEVIGLRDVITFQATDVDSLKNEFKESIDDYLEFCAERGEKPEKTYSGKFNLRVSPELHMKLAVHAAKDGKSLNNWIADKLSHVV